MDPKFLIVNDFRMIKDLKNVDIKKANDVDTKSPKPVKLSADFLTPLLTKAINASNTQSVLPENAKTASVTPLDKGKPNKNKMSHFRSMSVPNTFSKVYERGIKDQIGCGM